MFWVSPYSIVNVTSWHLSSHTWRQCKTCLVVTKLASLKWICLMENSRKMQTVLLCLKRSGRYWKKLICSIITSWYIKYRPNKHVEQWKKIFSSGASVAVAGIHLYVFLSLNLNFGACTINTLNVTLSNRTITRRECRFENCRLYVSWRQFHGESTHSIVSIVRKNPEIDKIHWIMSSICVLLVNRSHIRIRRFKIGAARLTALTLRFRYLGANGSSAQPYSRTNWIVSSIQRNPLRVSLSMVCPTCEACRSIGPISTTDRIRKPYRLRRARSGEWVGGGKQGPPRVRQSSITV